MVTIPRIISVDDHVVEPPTLWTDRLPSKYADRAPRVVRDRARFSYLGGVFRAERGVPDGDWCDWWLYDDLEYPFARLSAAVGFDSVENVPTTFDEIRPGTWKQKERLEDMDANHMDVSICFPNVLPRFCGQTFYEREDKELALLCVQAYNDWVIDEWCAGEGKGRLIPLTIVPLWDPELAAEEIHRCARKGSYAVTFSENPFHLGLPSVHDPGRFWDPFFRACEETGTTLNMHIGSSSKMPSTSSDAPHAVGSVLTFSNTMGSLLDFLISGVFDRFPRMKVAYSEGQVGWMPFVLERADKIWEKRMGATASYGMTLEHPPSSYVADRIWGCIFDDVTGLRLRNEVGMGQITFEVDYPHADSTFPNTLQTATRLVEEAGLDQGEVDQLFRTNAIRAYGLERFGITS
ncbi:MAG: amidohydrolase [Deltaproteobacteria bacterium]|jgi:predicted TIM-barrel fold metal-dependent hydrolase|nr:amidohydrolase [Deltaproteobacteria bacterium]